MMRALVVMVAVVVTEQTGAMEAGVKEMANAPCRFRGWRRR